MSERLDPPEEAAGLGVAARRYAAHLLGAAADFYPGAVEGVRSFFALLGQAEEGNADAPELASWAWARFLAGWPAWRPHRLERRLLLPPVDHLRDLSARAREAAGPMGSGYRRWSRFLRAARTTTATEPRDLFAHIADTLHAVAAPTPPAAAAALDRAVELGRSVDVRLAQLPTDWVPARLARAAGALDEWPSDPTDDGTPGFLPWLAALVRSALDRGSFLTAPEAFAALLREALDDLRAGGHIPAEGEPGAALDAFRKRKLPVPESEWFRVLGALLDPAPRDDAKSPWPRLLAQFACRAVEQVVPNAEPPVDPDSLTVLRDWCRPGRAEVRYVVHPSAPRTVVRVERFAIPPDRATLAVSLGAKPAGTTIWLTVTGPDRLARLPDGEGTRLCARCRNRAEAEFWTRNAEADDPRTLRKEWAAWLGTEPGRDWFHALASKAASTGKDASEARARLAAVSHTAGVACFPPFDPEIGHPTWPINVPLTQARVSFAADDGPPGSILAVDRFACQPEAARFRVCLGPTGAAGMAVAAVWDAIVAAGLELVEFRGKLGPALEAASRTGDPVSTDLLATMLDRLGELENAGGGAKATLDALLSRLREWATAAGLTVQPAEWTFAAGGPAPPTDTPGLAVKPVFRRDVPGCRIVKVKAFGLAGPETALRIGEVVTSAGPAPTGLTEVEAAAEGIPGPGGEEMREACRGLRAAGAGGYLELAVIDLFTRFWDHVHPTWANADPAAAEEFAQRLQAMLRAGFGLDSFAPTDYRDRPNGWITVPPGTRMTSGRVLRVLRPGLARGDELRVPSRVEAE